MLLRVITELSCRRGALVLNLQHAYSWIGRGRGCVQNWPARSPDLTRMYFHLLKHTENIIQGQNRHEGRTAGALLHATRRMINPRNLCFSTFHLEMGQTSSPG